MDLKELKNNIIENAGITEEQTKSILKLANQKSLSVSNLILAVDRGTLSQGAGHDGNFLIA